MLTVYALVSYSKFGFQNGIFTVVSGGFNIPAVITFSIGKDGTYTLKDYKEAQDGDYYWPSLQEMFPFYLWPFMLSDGYSDNLDKQQEAYAQKYLNSIGRNAVVQTAVVDRPSADMETQTSNKLYTLYNDYPGWIGTEEKIENGTRYVYKQDWQSSGNGDGVITFTKYIYASNTVVEKTVIQIKNGEIIFLEGVPRTKGK